MKKQQHFEWVGVAQEYTWLNKYLKTFIKFSSHVLWTQCHNLSLLTEYNYSYKNFEYFPDYTYKDTWPEVEKPREIHPKLCCQIESYGDFNIGCRIKETPVTVSEASRQIKRNCTSSKLNLVLSHNMWLDFIFIKIKWHTIKTIHAELKNKNWKTDNRKTDTYALRNRQRRNNMPKIAILYNQNMWRLKTNPIANSKKKGNETATFVFID